MKKKSLSFNAFLNGIRNVLNLIFPLITFPYVSRILSVQGIGINNFSSTYVNYFVLIAGLGIDTYAIREGAKYRSKKEVISKFSSQMFSINMLSTVCAYVLLILTLLVFTNLRNYILCILIYSLQIFFTTIGTEWIYTIYEDFSYITLRSIIFKIISIILLFLFVKKESDYLIYAGITVLATVGSNTLNYLHAKSLVRVKLTKSLDLRKHLKPILIIFATAITSTIYVSSDNTMLGLLKNDYSVGLYSVSVKIYSMVSGLVTSGLAVTLPRLAMLYGQKRMKEFNSIFFKTYNVLNLIALPSIVGLIMTSKDIILIVSGEKYLPSVITLQIIAVALIFSVFSWFISSCVLIPAKREKQVLYALIICSLVNVILNFILIPKWSYNAAAVTTVISELLSMVLMAYYAWDIIKDTILDKRVWANLLSIFIGCASIIGVCCLANIYIKPMMVHFVVSVVFSILIYFVILIVLKNPFVLDILEKFVERIKVK